MFYQGVRIDQTNERPRVDSRSRLYSLAGAVRKEARALPHLTSTADCKAFIQSKLESRS
jgi:hypothetical protein